jgi:hypothetical protein
MTSDDDGCVVGMVTNDLERWINSGGLYLGFAPSNDAYHIKVMLTYEGDLTVENL